MKWMLVLPFLPALAVCGWLAIVDAKRQSRRHLLRKRRMRYRGRADLLPPPDKAAQRRVFRFPQ